ncbi:MAG: PAS domain S-box protein [Nitrospiraceae bacterium]|nr:MAG: PAS domain S-box protein [Nitrospiraceae bacterium]
MKKTAIDRYRSIVETIPQGIGEIDTSGTILFSNAAHHKLLGYNEGELTGTSVFSLVRKSERKNLENLLARLVIEQPPPTPYYTENIKKDGNIVHVRVDWNYKRDTEGTVTGFIALVTDMSDLKKAAQELHRIEEQHEGLIMDRTGELEQANTELQEKIAALNKSQAALKETEQRFRDISENALDWIWEVDAEGKYVYSSPVVETILGYRVEEILEKHFYDLFHPDELESLKKAAFEVFARKEPFREFLNRNIHKSGSTVWISTSGIPLLGQDGRLLGYRGADTNITAYKEAEAQLMLSEGRYRALSEEFRALLDAIPDSILLMTKDLKIIWANRAFADLHSRDVVSLSGETCYRACCSISSPCNSCPVLKCFASGQEESTRVMTSEGRIYNKRAFPVRREDSDEMLHVIEVARDITAEVRMEEEARQVQTRLIHANKMTSLGTLVSGVAHEINNPNTYIMNNSQTALEIWNEASELLAGVYRSNRDLSLAGIPFGEAKKLMPKLLLGIYDGSVRIRNIVDNLKNFSRPDKSRLDGELAVDRVLMAATSILESQIRKFTTRYHITFEEDLPVLRGSEQQMEQVMINIIMNALLSLPGKEAGVRVSARFNRKRNIVEIRVKDEGTGIPPDVLDHAMEPFFTTRHNSGGTGLGLSISYTIVRDHGGSLLIKSKEGKGTTVTVELPVPA